MAGRRRTIGDAGDDADPSGMAAVTRRSKRIRIQEDRREYGTATFQKTFNWNNAPIFECLTYCLEIGDIISLTRTCRMYRCLYQELVGRQWDMDRVLRRYVKDPVELRNMIGKCDAIISGSAVLQFFERCCWPESDLDIFIEKDEDADALAGYLKVNEGFESSGRKTAQDDDFQWDYGNKYITWIETFLKIHNGSQSKVQIVGLTDKPIKHVLQSFYTSAIINFCTAEKAYSIYPLTTFVHHNTYRMKCKYDSQTAALAKYAERGWKTVDRLKPEFKNKVNSPLRRRRRVGDKYTWTISLKKDGLDPMRTPSQVVECTTFDMLQVVVTPGRSRRLAYWFNVTDISQNNLSGCSLRYEYIVSLSRIFKLSELVNKATHTQYMKLPARMRKQVSDRELPSIFDPDSQHLYRQFKRYFTAPSGWVYHDSEMLDWIREAESEAKDIEEDGWLDGVAFPPYDN